jgi:hypothetical protein
MALPPYIPQFEAAPEAFSPPEALSDPILFFVIDFQDFMCPACLESLLNLCRLLPAHILQERAYGVVVLPGGPDEHDTLFKSSVRSRSIRIMEQKIRGFQKANRIAFPLLLDREHIFRSLSDEGTSVVLFHPDAGSICKISFPLSRSDTERLLKIWAH